MNNNVITTQAFQQELRNIHGKRVAEGGLGESHAEKNGKMVGSMTQATTKETHPI